MFESSPYRVRLLSDLTEVLNAMARPYLPVHPTALPSTALLLVAVPLAFFKTLRCWSFTWAQALTLTAVLVSTTGFLSLTVSYVRPAKILSVVVLGLLLYTLTRYLDSRRRRVLVALVLLLFLGTLCDEVAFWFIPLTWAVLYTHGFARHSRIRQLWVLSVPVLFLATITLVLPPIYATFGTDGPRTAAAGDASGLASRMLPHLLNPDLYATMLWVTGRTVLGSLGVSQHAWPLVLLVIIGLGIGFASVLRRPWSRPRDRSLTGIALFGLLSTSAFSVWVDWFNTPHGLEDYASYAYYYHSPIVVWVVLCLGAVWQAAGRRFRPTVVQTAGVLVAMLLVASNIRMFSELNRAIQLVHLVPLAAEDVSTSLEESPLVVRPRAAELAAEFETRSRRLFGESWDRTEFASNFRGYLVVPDDFSGYVQRLCIGYDPRKTCEVQVVVDF
jgi:hypothetical protein